MKGCGRALLSLRWRGSFLRLLGWSGSSTESGEVPIQELTSKARQEPLCWPLIPEGLFWLMISSSQGNRLFSIMDGGYSRCISIFQKHRSRRGIESEGETFWAGWGPQEDPQGHIYTGPSE